MLYLVFCTFDLKNATSQNYTDAYADLKAIGLEKVVAGSNNSKVVIPTTAAMGKFNGSTAISVRDTVSEKVTAAFQRRELKSEIFIIVGGDWTWASRTT